MKIYYMLGSLAIPFMVFIIIVSYIIANHFTGFNMFKNSISDLGCKEHTPYYMIFNIGLFISGILLGFLFYGTVDMLSMKFPRLSIYFEISWIFFIIACIGISFIGVFSIEVSEKMHLIMACIAFGSIAIGEIIIGSVLLKDGTMTLFPMIIMPIFIVVSILFLIYGTRVPILEWIFFLVIMLWGLPLMVDFYKEVINNIQILLNL